MPVHEVYKCVLKKKKKNIYAPLRQIHFFQDDMCNTFKATYLPNKSHNLQQKTHMTLQLK